MYIPFERVADDHSSLSHHRSSYWSPVALRVSGHLFYASKANQWIRLRYSTCLFVNLSIQVVLLFTVLIERIPSKREPLLECTARNCFALLPYPHFISHLEKYSNNFWVHNTYYSRLHWWRVMLHGYLALFQLNTQNISGIWVRCKSSCGIEIPHKCSSGMKILHTQGTLFITATSNREKVSASDVSQVGYTCLLGEDIFRCG